MTDPDVLPCPHCGQLFDLASVFGHADACPALADKRRALQAQLGASDAIAALLAPPEDWVGCASGHCIVGPSEAEIAGEAGGSLDVDSEAAGAAVSSLLDLEVDIQHDPAAPTLWLGSSHRARDVDWLVARGIGFVLNVADDVDSPAEAYQAAGIRFTHLELADTSDCDIGSHLPDLVAMIHAQRVAGTSVFVHCSAGVSRSGTVAIAYVMVHGEAGGLACDSDDAATGPIPLVDAWQAVRGRRRYVSPNKGFALALVELEAELRGENSITAPMLALHGDQTEPAAI